MLRVLVITYYWPPAGGAGVQRWLKLCKYLPENGVLPTVITVDPDKATYPQRDESMLSEVHPDIEVIRTDSFEPLSWYGRLVGKKNVPYGGFANVSNQGVLSKVSRFIRGNFFIPDARKGWNKFAYRAAKQVISEKNIDVVITTGPPHSTHLVGLRLKNELGVKWVADFRDPWTGIYYYDEMLHTHWAASKDQKMEQEVLLHADVVLSVCESNLEGIRKLAPGSAKNKLRLFTNGFDKADFKGKIPKVDSHIQIGYTGTLANSYAPEPLLKALKKLSQSMNFRLKVAGRISPEVMQFIRDIGLNEKMDFVGYVSHEDAVKILRESHLLLHILPNIALNAQGTTGKLFDYIGSGTPILNVGPKSGDSASIIAESNAGETFEHTDVDGMLEYMTRTLNNPEEHETRNNGERLQFERSVQAKRLKEVLNTLVLGD